MNIVILKKFVWKEYTKFLQISIKIFIAGVKIAHMFFRKPTVDRHVR